MPARRAPVIEEAEQVAAAAEEVPYQVTNYTPAGMPERADRNTKSETFTTDKLGSFKTYRWLDILNEAYKHGFVGFVYSHVQPYDTIDRNGNKHTTWVASATAQFADGSVHTAVGEANYENCNKQIGNAAARMAETRAKSRALAHALNLDANVDFEMEDPNNPGASAIQNNPAPRAAAAQSAPSNSNGYTPKKIDPSQYPPENVPGGWACEVCGEEISDSGKYTAGERAFFSARKNGGKILCWTHQNAATGS